MTDQDFLIPKRDLSDSPFASRDEEREYRHQDITHKRRDEFPRRPAYDHGESETDDVTLLQELPELSSEPIRGCRCGVDFGSTAALIFRSSSSIFSWVSPLDKSITDPGLFRYKITVCEDGSQE